MPTALHLSEALRNYALFGAAIIGLPLAIWRSFIAHRQSNIADANHQAEIYTKAIDQIGQVENAIKLGGLYALKKLAFTNKDYHVQIMEVLCAFVRLHAQKNIPTKITNSGTIVIPLTPIIVQTALTIIANRNISFDVEEMVLNFSSSEIYEASLHRANLHRANFEETSLKEAHLQGANLEWANLQRANLQGANLQGANLQGANLQGANLQGANLYWANLQGANLQGASLHGANIGMEEIYSAIIDEDTLLPDGITRDIIAIHSTVKALRSNGNQHH